MKGVCVRRERGSLPADCPRGEGVSNPSAVHLGHLKDNFWNSPKWWDHFRLACFFSTGRFKTGFWAFMSVFCLVFLIYHTTTVSLYFFQYKYNVAVVLVNKRELVFPAVTVCNLNPVKASAVTTSSELAAALGISATSTGKNVELILAIAVSKSVNFSGGYCSTDYWVTLIGRGRPDTSMLPGW